MMKITNHLPPAKFTKLYFALKNAITNGAVSSLFYGAKHHGPRLPSFPKQVCVFMVRLSAYLASSACR